MIKDLEEKQLQVTYFLSRGNRSLVKSRTRVMNRVPHCSECNICISTKYVYTSFYCCEENEKSKIYASLGVGHPLKTSPKWCPKIAKEN